MFRNFEPHLFRLALEVVTRTSIELSADEEEIDEWIPRYDAHIITHIFRSPVLLTKKVFSFGSTPHLNDRGKEENGRLFIIKTCQLMYLLDQCATQHVIRDYDRLFTTTGLFTVRYVCSIYKINLHTKILVCKRRLFDDQSRGNKWKNAVAARARALRLQADVYAKCRRHAGAQHEFATLF